MPKETPEFTFITPFENSPQTVRYLLRRKQNMKILLKDV
jgi:hypothetical protein